jgi:uncharacterized lipoprotein YmbA
MIRLPIALVFAVATIGCASDPPIETAQYLLRADAPADLSPADPARRIGIGRVSIAPYLDRAGVVMEVDANQVREARYHEWAEPLDRGIQLYLQERVAVSLGQALNDGTEDAWRYRIDLSVEEFHGRLDGEVRLIAQWSLRDLSNGRVVATQRFSRSRQQTSEGYPAMVAAQIELLDELAEAIARVLRQVDVPA